MHNYIHVDSLLWVNGLYLSSKCQCCYHIENINYFFVNGVITTKIWEWYDTTFDTSLFPRKISRKHLLDNYFTNASKGHIKIIVAISHLEYLDG